MSQYPATVQLSTLNGTTGFVINGIDIDDRTGRSVAGAGDVNDDGFADMVIGASDADPNGDSGAGESYIVFGKASWGAFLNLGALGAGGVRLDGIDPGDESGFSVSGAGDVNDDGFDDVIVGAQGAFSGGDPQAGETYVVFGKAAGSWSTSLDLGSLNGTTGFRLDGVNLQDRSGGAVDSAGDLDGDGIDDLIVAAPGFDPGGDSGAGAAYVVFGQTSWSASFDLGSVNGTTGFRIDGIDPGDGAGLHVSRAGDVNGDTYDDLIIAAANIDDGGSEAGGAFVVFGAPTWSASFDLAGLTGANGLRLDGVAPNDNAGEDVAGVGDLNGDGLADLGVSSHIADPGGRSAAGECYVVFGASTFAAGALDLATLDGDNGFRVEGLTSGDFLGTSISSAGDVNADGFDDLLLGGYGVGGSGGGYVIFGKKDGWDATVDLAALDGNNGFALQGVAGSDQAGYRAAAAGDVNGDGVDDLMISAPQLDAGGDSNAGAVFVVFGALPGEAVVREGSDIGQVIRGGAFADALSGLGGNDSLYGNDGADTLEGGAGDDRIEGGAGKDVVSYEGSSAAVTVSLVIERAQNTVGAGLDTLIDIDSFNGSRFGDTVFGDAAGNKILGMGGNDTLWASAGRDILSGSGGNDTATFDAAAAAVTVNLTLGGYQATGGFDDIKLNGIENVIGSDFRDTITGGADDNVLNGGLDNDTLTGGLGSDTVTGGFGSDKHFYNALADSTAGDGDLITDLSDAFDTINLSAIDADDVTGGNQAFVVVAVFTNTAGELRLTYDGGSNTTTAAGDTDGDGVAEMEILLTGDHTAYTGFVL